MDADPTLLFDLAGRVADGAPVDWAAISTSPRGSEIREVLDEMALLARIGQLHRTFPASPAVGHAGAAAEAEATQLDRWGDLLLIDRVGSGAAGEVFRAYDDQLQREVALKLLHIAPDAHANSPLAEGRLLARVRHPNVVTVFGAASFKGRAGLWMEFIHGRTLVSMVREQDRKSTRLNSSHLKLSRMPSSA